jgi:hypothetical protein
MKSKSSTVDMFLIVDMQKIMNVDICALNSTSFSHPVAKAIFIKQEINLYCITTVLYLS